MGMKFLFAPYGSEGDVNPLVWLAEGLAARGHEITFLLTPHYSHRIIEHGWSWHPVGTEEDFQRFARDPRLWKPNEGTRFVIDGVMHSWASYESAFAAAGYDFDLLVTSSLGLAASTIAEKHGIPQLTMHMQPTCLRSVYDCPLFLEGMDWLCNSPRFVKSLFFHLVDLVVWNLLRRPLNEKRTQSGLPPLTDFYTQALNGGAGVAAMFPPWFAAPQPDWPANVRQFGFPIDAHHPHLDPALEEYLSQGEPPVIWTHGSANFDIANFHRAAVDCALRTGLRSLLVSLDPPAIPLPPNVSHVPRANFGALFPRARAVVHHGGIGTTAKTIAAGVPHLIIPRSHDQPDNARRIAQRNLGRTLSYSEAHGTVLADTLTQIIGSPEIKASCAHHKTLLTDTRSPLCDWTESLARNHTTSEDSRVSFIL